MSEWVEIPAPADLVVDGAGNVQQDLPVTLKLAGTNTNVTHAADTDGSDPQTGALVTRLDGIGTVTGRRYVQAGDTLDITVGGRTHLIQPTSALASPIVVVAGSGGALLTDDQVLQAVLNAYAYQRPIEISGVLEFHTPVEVPSGTWLRGRPGAKIIGHSSSTGSLLANEDDVDGNDDITIEGIEVDGNKANRAATGPLIAMRITGGTAGKKLRRVYVRNCYVHDGDEQGIQYASVQTGHVTGCTVTNMDRDGIVLYYDCQDVDISGNHVADVKDDAIGCNAENSTTTGHTMKGVRIRGNYCRQSATATAGSGVSCHGLQESVVTGNVIEDSFGPGISVANWNTTAAKRLQIIGNTISRSGVNNGTVQPGIAVVGSRSVSSLNGAAGCDRITIALNDIDLSEFYGIRVLSQSLPTGLVSNVVVNGNTVTNSGQGGNAPGIKLQEAENCTVTGNHAYDNQGTKTQTFGLDAASCTGSLVVVGNDFAGNLTRGDNIASPAATLRYEGNITGESATVASAATLSIPRDARLVTVTGTTTISAMSARPPGHRVTLLFTGACTVNDSATVKLSAAFTSSADDTLTLISDGTAFYEIAPERELMPIILGDFTPVGTTEIVLDPSQVADSRVELHLNAGAIRVAEQGVDWGDAQIEQYRADLDRGQVPVDFRIPNRTITIPLVLGASGPQGFSGARRNLQAKVALLQQRRGWLRRGEGLYAEVMDAKLQLPGRYEHLGVDADVVLTVETLPDWFGDEIELDEITGTGDVIAVLQQDGVDAEILGDYPARTRIVVEDLGGQPQLGLFWGVRSRHYSAAVTAQPAYEAEAMTPLDAAAVFALAAGSGGNVVRHAAVRTTWTALLSTNLDVGGPLTHVGTYKVMARVHVPQPNPPDLRFAWGVGEMVNPIENATVRLSDSEGLYICSLGSVRLDPAPVGTHSWQGRIEAKKRSDGAGPAVSVDRIWFVPVDESTGTLRAPQLVQTPTSILASDDFTGTTAGAGLNGRAAPAGGSWVTSGDATDFVFSDTLPPSTPFEGVSRGAGSSPNGRYAVLGSTNYDDVQVEAYANTASTGGDPIITEAGVLARWVDASNFVRGVIRWTDEGRMMAIVMRLAGVETDLAEAAFSFSDPDRRVRLQVFASGRVALQIIDHANDVVVATLEASHAELAAGGDLVTGKVGLYDRNTDTGTWPKFYDDFVVSEPAPLDVVVHANGVAELRTDGMFREDASGGSYSVIGHRIGDLPRLPPSGLEGLPVELLLKASRGDLEDIVDAGIDDVRVQVFYRPSWLFVDD